MEKIEGRSFREFENFLTFESKRQLARTVADWLDQLSRLTFDEIWSLYC